MSNTELATPKKSGRTRTSGIERTVQIFDCLAEKGEPASAYEISKMINAPMSTIYTIVSELAAREMLIRDDEGLVWFGQRMMYYGLTCQAKLDFLVEAKKEMRTLCDEVDETIQICTRDRGMMVVTAMANGRGHFRITSDVGTRVPINWAASGRLLLGHLPHEERLSEFEKHSRIAPRGVVEMDPQVLSDQSRHDFEKGVAVQCSVNDPNVTCIASPIQDIDGNTIATISIVMSDQKAVQNLDYYTNALRKSASSIERRLGRRD